MRAALYDFFLEQGADFTPDTIVWLDGNNDPVNLTGYYGRMSVRKNKGDTSPIITLLTANLTPGVTNGTITLGGALGTIILHISAVLTRAMTFSKAFYDLELSPTADPHTSTDTIRVLEGMVYLSTEATKG